MVSERHQPMESWDGKMQKSEGPNAKRVQRMKKKLKSFLGVEVSLHVFNEQDISDK